MRSVAARAKQATWSAYMLRRFDALARGGRRERPICVVYGNCQAEPVRVLLSRSTAFAAMYETVRIPAVHEITEHQTARLERLLPMISLIVGQPIKDGYRSLPLGIDEIIALAPGDCRVIRFPALYYDALYPLQAIVHVDGRRAVPAPVTIYHDLRTLSAAAKGHSAEAALRWVSRYDPPGTALRAAAEHAAAWVRERESTTDIRVLDWMTARPQAHARSFFTVNHPARFVLEHMVRGIHRALGLLSSGESFGNGEPLGTFRAPLEQPVIDALELPSHASPDWIIKGKAVASSEVARLHLAWYRKHPTVVSAGLREHAERIATFGLLD